jgi:AraC-like DNA-binding protein
MAKTGPKGPSKPMTDKEFEQLVAMIRIQCTRDEICDVLNMSETTLNRRLKERGEHNFEALYKKHSGEGKASLRRMQWKAAEAGNPTMLVWLGKNMLDQKDKVEQDHTSSDGSMTPKEIIIRAADAKTSDD